MKKLIIASLISLSMVVPQLYSISVAEYIQQYGIPKFKYSSVGKELDLSDRGLTSLEGLQDVPRDILDQVSSLDLSSNQLQTLPNALFSNLPNLKGLNLDRNKLQILSDGIFSGLNKLEDLFL